MGKAKRGKTKRVKDLAAKKSGGVRGGNMAQKDLLRKAQKELEMYKSAQ